MKYRSIGGLSQACSSVKVARAGKQPLRHRSAMMDTAAGRPVRAILCISAVFFCFVAVTRASGVASARSLQQAGNSSCPLVFKQQDIADTIATCAKGTDPSIFFNVPCCTRIYGLLYQTRTRHANSTDQLLLSQDAAVACVQAMETSLVSAGLPPNRFSTCNVNSTGMWQPACGDALTTISAFKTLTNYSYPGSTSAACWNQPVCSACVASMSAKVASLQSLQGVNASLVATSECKDLANIALVAAAYPLSIANSIATCLWNSPVDNLPQSATCSLGYDAVDYSNVVRACGPLKEQGNRCCDTVLAVGGQVWYEFINRTGTPNYETETNACTASFKAALVANGLLETLYEECRLSSFIPLIALRCNKYTVTPPELQAKTEAVCAPGRCNASCTATVQEAFVTMAGPYADTPSISYCGIFFSGSFWPQNYGYQGAVDRANCYWNFPPELQLRILELGPSGRSKRRKALIASLVSVSVVFAFVAIAVMGLLLWRRQKRRTESIRDQDRFKAKLSKSRTVSEPLHWYSFPELRAATQNFAAKQLLGKGGSGSVYLGELPDGTRVAVKQLAKPSTPDGAEEFMTEVSSMVSCRHRHILTINGVHASDRQILLVYEYMTNGSLEDHLFTTPGESTKQMNKPAIFLDWPRRLKIALGTAKGLAYLHEDCKPRIIHRDVKPSNILLDQELEAKVGDFGLAKFTKDEETHVSTGVRGTWGFLSPEYVATGQVSEKSDVYAFGVVLLSLVTGRRPTDSEREAEEVFLTEWAWNVAGSGELLKLVDPALVEAIPVHEQTITVAIKVGLMCVHTVVNLRPTMRECFAMLSQQMELPSLPERPTTLFTVSSGRTNQSTSFATQSSTDTSSMRSFSLSNSNVGKKLEDVV
ncbi:Protein kinase superfamily protein [Klebsormidium nitens]|uniref:Protein kinase superfamily protein n=1 Tax=Klebsormidium nitens TaxID=105231 RepID=A0A1Y1IB02_KLENI|nr:Protein kinase superfamily protein [Klebsormidium nitens]|eukprot:GAQ86301.1 Protein kinase superfamily protein [Klebsormidium nitens]